VAKLALVEPEVPTPLTALAEAFLADKRANGLSLRTVAWYSDALQKEFLPWCAREGITDPVQLTKAGVGGFTARLLDQGGKRGPFSRATVRGYVRAARVFLAWAENPKGGAAKVGASPKMPRADRPLIDVLSREEIQRMENVAKSERDKLIVRVLADTGLRLGELLGLRVEDLHEPKRGEFALKVRGKGSKDRLVPVAPALHRRLKRYPAGRHAEGRDAVFVALRKGVDRRYGELTKSGAEQAVRVLGKEAGIDRRVYPHIFRHSFATEWLRRGQNIISLQRVLGHADLSMIQGIYSHLDTSDDYQAAMRVLLGQD
jgi:integrase/recombinase XerD